MHSKKWLERIREILNQNGAELYAARGWDGENKLIFWSWSAAPGNVCGVIQGPSFEKIHRRLILSLTISGKIPDLPDEITIFET